MKYEKPQIIIVNFADCVAMENSPAAISMISQFQNENVTGIFVQHWEENSDQFRHVISFK